MQAECKSCTSKRTVAYGKKNPEKRREACIKHLYGINSEEYEKLLILQNNKCAICLTDPLKRRLDIDHCHKTGRVRGLLCTRCNVALGKLKDDISLFQKAISYLESNK